MGRGSNEKVNIDITYPERVKHPRIGHLPWSKGRDDDDYGVNPTIFDNQLVVVTEKMDGENTTIYYDGFVHARSIDSSYHPSRSQVKQLAASVSQLIPEGWRVCGENMAAEHTISYSGIPVLLVHSIWDDNNCMLDYQQTVEYSELLGLTPAPLLYQGVFDQQKVKNSWKRQGQYGLSEGYVVRLKSSIPYNDFDKSIAKYVDQQFKVGEQHWSKKEMIPNQIKNDY
jgi:hypothetical protein